MAIKDIKNGAWADISTLKIQVSGAYQTATKANALVSGAWQTVWNSGHYFLKDGVLMNDAIIVAPAKQADGYVSLRTSQDGSEVAMVQFKITSDMATKKIYVRASSNVTTYNSNAYGHIRMIYPIGANTYTYVNTDTMVNGFFVFSIPSNMYYESWYRTSIGIGKTYPNAGYSIYDIYLA